MRLSFLIAHKDEIILALDLFGTAIFAITGALRGFRRHLDFLGVCVLACAVGIGGGMMRDALIGATPVAAFQDGRYLIICVVMAVGAFFVAPRLSVRWNVIPVLDAVGLGVFTAIGCEKAALYGCGNAATVLCGVMTAVGGGVIRDVLVMRIPAVLRSDFYATAAALGGGLFLILLYYASWADYFGRFLLVSGTVLLIRLVAMRFKFHLPASHAVPNRQRWHFRHPRRRLPKE
ncbi:MAG: trimeric intracellular cation channel family protein [Kiritimatiellae bacterium]|nr:trimeric intracellular cation channel family protein [Kiritimatiellia bacterium]